MTKAACSRTAEQLTRYLTVGGELPPELIEHISHCSECGETLKRAQLLGDFLARLVTSSRLPLLRWCSRRR